jgi:proteasome lid subunit RPN8/RPN11
MQTNQEDNLKDELIKFAESSPMREVCGFIVYENGKLSFEQALNISKADDYFEINPVDFLQMKIKKTLLAIFHTHPDCVEEPSEYDIKSSKNCLYPFLIYSLETQKFHLFDMPYFERSEKGVSKLRDILND